MYVPKQFREERAEVLVQAVRDIGLATLVTASPAGLVASHVPMVPKADAGGALTLESHVARPNEHWAVLRGPTPSLAVFQGPQAYISPSWYETKAKHGKVVPTWNYIAVHAHGALEAVEGDEAWLLAHLDDLTRSNEGRRPHPWAISDAPEGFVRTLARGIVGLRLRVERLEGSWKMIQHRPEGDRLGAIAGLSGSPDPRDRAVADVMRRLEADRARPPAG